MSDLTSKLKAVATEWREGDPLTAYELLSDAVPECSWLVEVVGQLCEARIVRSDEVLASAEMRKALDQAADTVQTPTDPRGISSLIESLVQAARSEPRLAWLANAHVDELLAPTTDRPVTLAVLGEFSSGKSSLINALLGEKVLSVGMVPVTSTVVRLHHAPVPGGEAVYPSGRRESFELDAIRSYIDERSRRDEGQERPSEVRIGFPADFLRNFEIVDTPGFNSGVQLHDQAAAGIVLQADAVLWIFDATQAGKNTELEELKHIQRANRCFGIVNKIDALEAEPGEAAAVVAELSSNAGEVFERVIAVSAKRIVGGLPDSGAAEFLSMLGSVRESARAIMEESLQRRRAELARKELARRVLVGREHEELALHRLRLRMRLDEMGADWKEAIAVANGRPEAFQVDPALLKPWQAVLQELLSVEAGGLSDAEAAQVLDAWRSAERHSALAHCSLSSTWRMLHSALGLVFTTREPGKEEAAYPPALKECFEEYCRRADRLLLAQDDFDRLVDRASTARASAEALAAPYSTSRYQPDLLEVEDPWVLSGIVVSQLARYGNAPKRSYGTDTSRATLRGIYDDFLRQGSLRFAQDLVGPKYKDAWKSVKDGYGSYDGRGSFARTMMQLAEKHRRLEVPNGIPAPLSPQLLAGRVWDGTTWRTFYRCGSALDAATKEVEDFESELLSLLTIRGGAAGLGPGDWDRVPGLRTDLRGTVLRLQLLAAQFRPWAEELAATQKRSARWRFVYATLSSLLGAWLGYWVVGYAYGRAHRWVDSLGAWDWACVVAGVVAAGLGLLLFLMFVGGGGYALYEWLGTRGKQRVGRQLEAGLSRWVSSHMSVLQDDGLLRAGAVPPTRSFCAQGEKRPSSSLQESYANESVAAADLLHRYVQECTSRVPALEVELRECRATPARDTARGPKSSSSDERRGSAVGQELA